MSAAHDACPYDGVEHDRDDLILVEPWSGVYDRLLVLALEGPDPTFAWIVRIDGLAGWVGLALFSGFVTLYSEELFFRGWLLQALNRRTTPKVAVVGQTVVFTIFQSIPVFFFNPLQRVLYLLIYAFGLGVIVGEAAQRTQSVWPRLDVVTIANLVLTAALVFLSRGLCVFDEFDLSRFTADIC